MIKSGLFFRVSILLVAIVVFTGALWLFAPPQLPNTIVLTEKGFSPREITIKQGETVTFVNKRTKYFWPASDFHPTHTNYPAFDAKKALAPDASWQFTFDTPGLFKYHDHLAPFFFGIVRVTDEEGNFSDECSSRGGELACWQDKIFIALAEEGLASAYDTVAELYESEPTFAQSCHYIAHNIGLASYGFYREDPQSIMSPKASVCAAGFYHGFMEAYLGAVGDIQDASAVCETIGDTISNEAPDARLQCYHGIGHGVTELLIAETGAFNNLNDMVSGALAQCEQASDGTEERFRCASGLFNGIANFYINGEYGLDPATENPFSLCSSQKEEYQEACYGNMNSFAFWATDNNFQQAVQLALEESNPSQERTIITYLAGLYAYNTLPDIDSAQIIADCRSLGTQRSLVCIEGFVHGVLEHGTPHDEYKDALRFCQNTTLTALEKKTCYQEALSELEGWYSPEVSLSICESLSEELQLYCKK